MHANIEPERWTEIEARLAELEAEQNLRVIYACESGSRAWGFPSLDSDYDVRFLYVRPLDWYLSVGSRPDVIDQTIDGDLDLGGWDARKALGLLKKGNAPLIEWLASPIVYREIEAATTPLRRLVDEALLPESVCHHYLAQTRRILARVEELEQGKPKSYFYAMRAVLAARWVVEKKVPPPMEIWALLDGIEPNFCSRDRLDQLAAEKRQSREGGTVERLLGLEAGIRAEHDRLNEAIPKNGPPTPIRRFDQAFLEILRVIGELPATVGTD